MRRASNVRRAGNTIEIRHGTREGANLFHSFEEFSVPEGDTASFRDVDPDISNIFSRVTGSNISRINGSIEVRQVDGSISPANLFLLNPNGVIFGLNASLNIGGSFLATTANSFVFSDGREFSATTPQASPLLSVNVPIGLQFGSNPGTIVNRSYVVIRDSLGNLVPDPSGDEFTGLAVRPSRTLALVGGRISLLEGELAAKSGRIELGSVMSPDQVRLSIDGAHLRLNYDDVQSLGDIRLSAADVNASGAGGGTVRMRGDRILATESSLIRANTLGDGNGRGISIHASRLIELDGYGTGVFVRPNEGATGTGGNLSLSTDRLRILGGAQANTTTFGGAAGSMTVDASEIELVGVAFENGAPVLNENGVPESPSGLLGGTFSESTGGSITVRTQHLSLRDGAVLQTSTVSNGNAGQLRIEATEIEVIGTAAGTFPTGIIALSGGLPDTIYGGFPTAIGRGGDLRINTGELRVRDEAIVATGSLNSTERARGAGEMRIDAQTLTLDNQASLLANTNSGQGGDINLQIGNLLVLRHGSEISTTAGIAGTAGDGGSITIDASNGFIVTFPNENSDIKANAFEGSGGDVNITAVRTFGLEPRSRDELERLLGSDDPTQLDPRALPTNDITAISQTSPSLSGEININSPDVDPTRGLAELPTVPVTTELAQGCQVEGGVASAEFFNTGRGGVPATPYEPLSDDGVLDDVRLPIQQDVLSEGTDSVSVAIPPDRLIEAQGWIVDEAGQVVLIAEVPDSPLSTGCSLH